ncbi:MAG: nucleotide sugar dehydrogenase [bacterium]|nr:nucleotide sugar dehydrogenase [bacterium]
MKKIKKIAVIGLGYVGFPTLKAIQKTRRYQAVGFDTDKKKIAEIKVNGKFVVSNSDEILTGSDVFIICVPTPVLDNFTPDYSFVVKAAETAAKYIKKNSHFVLESTVNPGTCEEIILPVLEKITGLTAGKDFNIAHCPERINPGDKKWNVYNINRNIGSINLKFNKEVAKIYRTFISHAQINEVSSLRIAEASKVVENAFRDINIAFVNELAQSFDCLGIDLIETLKAAGNKPFSFMAHWPGCGVGGHCIAVDPYYLISRAKSNGFDHRFLKLAREINNSMPDYTVSKLVFGLNKIGFPVKGTKVALLGLSYKPDVCDLRNSPSTVIKSKLEQLGAKVVVYDPYVKGAESNLESAIKDATAVVIATAHTEIIKNLPGYLKKFNVRVLVDGRNCLNKEEIKKTVGIYYGIGR